jgi:hypothetical protein
MVPILRLSLRWHFIARPFVEDTWIGPSSLKSNLGKSQYKFVPKCNSSLHKAMQCSNQQENCGTWIVKLFGSARNRHINIFSVFESAVRLGNQTMRGIYISSLSSSCHHFSQKTIALQNGLLLSPASNTDLF